jgi:hypothetical protein
MAKGPQFTRYILPILHVLREMGGSPTAAEVTDAVIERFAQDVGLWVVAKG